VSLSAVYNNTSAKITVSISGAPANAQTVLLQRSTDQITWTTVRGASSLTLSGSAVAIDDYEFTDGVVNYYQARYTDATGPTYQTSGALATTTASGATASVTPALPSGITDGDTVYLLFSCTKATATLTGVTGGFTGVWAASQLTIYGVRWFPGIAAPTITWGGLASGDIVMAKTIRYRNAGTSAGSTITVVGAANAATTSIATPGNTTAGSTGMRLVYQSSTHTSVSPVATTDDHATGYALMAYHGQALPLTAVTITVTGGTSAVSDVLDVSISAYGTSLATVDTGSATPALTTVWIKNPIRPYLNRAVNIIGVADVTRPARTGVFDVIARTLPVAVTDLLGGRSTTVTVRCPDRATSLDLENCLLTGETLFIHSPNGAVAPTGYFVLGTMTKQRPASTIAVRYLQLPITEVAQPSSVIAATLSSWQTVVSTYSTWSAVIAAQASWTTLLQLVGSPSDVITS
jgi:hypothetical protein